MPSMLTPNQDQLVRMLTKQSPEEMELSAGDRITAQVKAQHLHLIGR